MAKEGNLLIVDDNSSILGALRLLLERHFAKVTTLTSPKLLDTVLRGEAVDAVLLDMNFTAGVNNGNEGIYWLRRIRDIRPDVKVVLFTAYADVDLAVRSMRDGAVDFVVKPWDNERLVASLRNACELARSQREVKLLREIRRELTVDEPMFWGTSPAMERIREIVEKVAATDANILITGENGTGKEMLAREIHRRSHRSGGPMVAVDMGAVPETLFESELFGHVKGAFTDARTDRAGKFEVADGGTLFLDEIGNLPLHLQPKLLTALQSGAIVRVGSNLPVKVDCQHRQCGSHADPVVGAERRPLGTHPAVVDAGADRVVLEVERHVRIFLADHIHMRLENHRRTPFVTGRRRFADHDVARRVAPVLQSVLLRPAYQVVAYLLLLLRGPRYARDRLEFRPHLAGCEFRQICHLCFGLNMHKITKEYPF